jgi:DNA-binding MarR family transcriptional regulator
MESPQYKHVVNELLVDIFNDILKVEHKAIESFAGNTLTMSEMHIMEAIGNNPDQKMSEIARQLKITLPTLTVSVQRLEEKGYITRNRFGADRRKVAVSLTERGRRAYDDHAAFHEKMVDSLFEGLNIDKMPVLMDSMALLRDFFKQQADRIYNEEKPL